VALTRGLAHFGSQGWTAHRAGLVDVLAAIGGDGDSACRLTDERGSGAPRRCQRVQGGHRCHCSQGEAGIRCQGKVEGGRQTRCQGQESGLMTDMQRDGKLAAPLSFCLPVKSRRENPLWFLPAHTSRSPASARLLRGRTTFPLPALFPSIAFGPINRRALPATYARQRTATCHKGRPFTMRENHEGISKECGKGGKPVSWLSMLSILCHFHGLLFARQMLDKPICRQPTQSAALATRCSSVLIACH
jgi:hypothetical protein